ncbi:MAG: hypothetical protein CSA33_01880 [Desulfobulbus propionicus]|nr:MAG: hypothetical protein CSA33_01880 [Desulfobulbus propionicus]
METNTAFQDAQTQLQAPLYQTTPLHQYVGSIPPQQAQPMIAQPIAAMPQAEAGQQIAVHPQPQPSQQVPAQNLPQNPTEPLSPVLSAGIFGFIVAGTGAMGAHLHRVQEGEMSITQAVADSVLKGVAGGTAAAGATAAANSLTTGGTAGLVVTLAAATGMSYLFSK